MRKLIKAQVKNFQLKFNCKNLISLKFDLFSSGRSEKNFLLCHIQFSSVFSSFEFIKSLENEFHQSQDSPLECLLCGELPILSGVYNQFLLASFSGSHKLINMR